MRPGALKVGAWVAVLTMGLIWWIGLVTLAGWAL